MALAVFSSLPVVVSMSHLGCRHRDPKSATTHGCSDPDACEEQLELCRQQHDTDERKDTERSNEACVAAGAAAVERRDVPTAVTAYGHACDRGEKSACDGLARVAVAIEPHDAAAAFKLLHRACQGGSGAGCHGLGLAYFAGTTVERNVEYALFSFQKACDDKFAEACKQIGGMYDAGEGVSRDDARAAEFYAKGCDAGNAKACYSAGEHANDGRGTPRDEFKAASYFNRACEARDDDACQKLAIVTQRNPAISTYLENQRRMEAERKAREAEARARESEAKARTAERPECKMGSDGIHVCGYDCKMGADRHVACADTPNGRCAMSTDGSISCSQIAPSFVGAGMPPPECKMGADGRKVCGYNCRMGSNGRMYCSRTPNGKCAFNADGTFSCP
jgi:TPR repeat protein